MAEPRTTGSESRVNLSELADIEPRPVDTQTVNPTPKSPPPRSPPLRAPPTALEWLFERAQQQPPVRGWELLAVGLMVVLADWLLYRGYGYSGYAAFLAGAPLLLLMGAPLRQWMPSAWVVIAMIVVLIVNLVWSGTGLLVAIGFMLLVAFAMCITGRRPYVSDVGWYACQSIAAGFAGLLRYWASADRLASVIPRSGWTNFMLPAVAVLGFGTLFILANPDVASAVSQALEQFFDSFWERVLNWKPDGGQLLLWIAVAWISIGLIRPVIRKQEIGEGTFGERVTEGGATISAEAPLYVAYRNMLVALIALFAVYLVFEFVTLWFREFPEGFHYSGYAHQGAAWLTVALAAATLVLSIVFRPRLFQDPRLPKLRQLAWIWSAQNLLLALSVYNRLLIYVGFNGMTRMRVVGLLGITAVLIGFVLVIRKIVRRRSFVWLIHRQLWTLALAIYLFAVLPVDALVHSYNVRRILAGDPAPSVQISVHPICASGVLVLTPLVNCDDEIIREGVRALLAGRAEEGELLARRREKQGWTSIQLADRVLLDKLLSIQSEWQRYIDLDQRAAAIDRFGEYSYQWY